MTNEKMNRKVLKCAVEINQSVRRFGWFSCRTTSRTYFSSIPVLRSSSNFWSITCWRRLECSRFWDSIVSASAKNSRLSIIRSVSLKIIWVSQSIKSWTLLQLRTGLYEPTLLRICCLSWLEWTCSSANFFSFSAFSCSICSCWALRTLWNSFLSRLAWTAWKLSLWLIWSSRALRISASTRNFFSASLRSYFRIY